MSQQNIENQLSQMLQNSDLNAARKLADSLNVGSLGSIKLLLLCATVYRQTGFFTKASQCTAKAMLLDPTNFALKITYANDLLKLGQQDSAENLIKKLPKEQQDNVNSLEIMAKIAYQKKNYQEAELLLKKAIKKEPHFATAHLELAHSLLMQEKWAEGWEEYEWRYKLANTKHALPEFKMPHWDGKETEHLLLIADQGYGDCFQFARYIPLAAERCKKITLMRSLPMARILDGIKGIDQSFANWSDTPLTTAYSTLSGLPRLFETTKESIPSCEDLLIIDEASNSFWQEKINNKADGKLKIGLTWSGRVEFGNNFTRALTFEKLKPLLDTDSTCFFSLQVGEPAQQCQGNNKITDLSNELTDFAETAAAMNQLDLIITTDTSVAHLAGTLGKPTWVLLSHSPDWRWGHDSSSSIWYGEHLKLVRQPEAGDWNTVINECCELLTELAASEPETQLS